MKRDVFGRRELVQGPSRMSRVDFQHGRGRDAQFPALGSQPDN